MVLQLWAFCFLSGVLLMAASSQDWKTSSVAGEICLTLGLICGLAMNRLGFYLAVLIVVVIMAILFYAPLELPGIGDADLIPFMLYLSIYLSRTAPFSWLLVYPVCLLLVLFPYAKFYAKKHGTVWKFGACTPMPMLPAFTLAWWLAIACTIILWFVGVR